MNFVVSHIYREGNQCTDSLANIGLANQGLSSWESAPAAICYFLFNESLEVGRLMLPLFVF